MFNQQQTASLESYIFEITCKEIFNLTHAARRSKSGKWSIFFKKGIDKFDIMVGKLALSRSKS